MKAPDTIWVGIYGWHDREEYRGDIEYTRTASIPDPTSDPRVVAVVEALPRWIEAMGDWDKGGPQSIEEMTAALAAMKGQTE